MSLSQEDSFREAFHGMAVKAKLSFHQLGRTKTGTAGAGLIWGLLEASVLMVAAYLTSTVSVTVIPNDSTFTDSYIGAIWSVTVLFIAGLAALMGYLLQEEQAGFSAFLFSQAIAFALFIGILSLFPLPKNAEIYFAALFVFGLAILVFFLGLLAILGGALLREQTREQTVSEWRIRLDWRFLAAGLLMDAVAVFWPLTPPYPQGYVAGGFSYNWVVPLRMDGLADLIMAALIGLGLFLTLLGLRRSVSTAFATLPLLVGSTIVAACGYVVHGFTSLIYNNFSGPGYNTIPSYSSQAQAFFIFGWLLILSLAVPAIISLGAIYSKKIR
jgi:hypothetical protein